MCAQASNTRHTLGYTNALSKWKVYAALVSINILRSSVFFLISSFLPLLLFFLRCLQYIYNSLLLFFWVTIIVLSIKSVLLLAIYHHFYIFRRPSQQQKTLKKGQAYKKHGG